MSIERGWPWKEIKKSCESLQKRCDYGRSPRNLILKFNLSLLFRYGADPNTNVKGTRPLHEALEGGHIGTVLQLLRHGSDPLLYDYSGNMPIDLAKESEDKKLLDFFSKRESNRLI